MYRVPATQSRADVLTGGPDLVTYAVVDAQTGSMLSSHGSFDAARAEAAQSTTGHSEQVSIYVFDDTGHVAGECADSRD
jgi:hypothetical protein